MSGINSLTPELLSSLGEWLRKPDEPDRVYTKNKKIEVVFLVEAVNAILPRTEGVEDITLIKLPGTEYEVPVILPEKLQAVARRRMLANLRRFRDKAPGRLKEHLESLVAIYKVKVKNKEQEVSFIKAKEVVKDNKEWNCFIQPPGGDIKKATDIGMDGFCPACVLFGTTITNDVLEIYDQSSKKNVFGESVGVKSRVEFDPAFAFLDQEKSVAEYTHNKVSDGVSWTGQSLYEEKHVVPGTVFIGKVALEDVTETELKAFLATLASIDRLGGRERVFGGVRIHLLGIKGGSHEIVSALELSKELARKLGDREYPPDVNEIEKLVKPILQSKGFEEINSDDFRKLLDDMNLWDNLWRDTVEYDRQIVLRVLGLIKSEENIKKA